MDWMMLLMYVVPSVFTGAGGWFVGKSTKRKRKNDILQEMQVSIDRLFTENGKLLHEIVEVKSQNAELKVAIKELELKNDKLRKVINELSAKLKNNYKKNER